MLFFNIVYELSIDLSCYACQFFQWQKICILSIANMNEFNKEQKGHSIDVTWPCMVWYHSVYYSQNSFHELTNLIVAVETIILYDIHICKIYKYSVLSVIRHVDVHFIILGLCYLFHQ